MAITLLLFLSILTVEIATAIAAWLSFFVAFLTVCYAKKQYDRHLKEEYTKLLCQYNQRYSTDCNIRTMLDWMLKVAISDNNGDIVGVDLSKSYYKPGINTKEMFMRFFEELQVQIENKYLNAYDVYDLFAYYAIRFDRFEEYHKDIKDYTRIELVKKESHSSKNTINNNWKRFSNFIELMTKIENKKK